MDISLSDFVTFLAALSTIAAVVAAAIRNLRDGRQDNGPIVVWTTTVIIVILVVGMFVSRVAAATPLGQPHLHIDLPQQNTAVTPAATPSLSATLTPTASSSPTAILTPLPTSTPVYSTLTPYDSGIFTPNWRFDCGGCDEPVRVMVSQVAIDAANENMVWTLAFDNHTAADVNDVHFSQLQLTDPAGVRHNATGPAMTSSNAVIRAGQTAQLQATFAFLPRHGAAYALTAKLYIGEDLFNYRTTTYGPQTIML